MWKKITTNPKFEEDLRIHTLKDHPEIDPRLPLEELLEQHDDSPIHTPENEGHESPWDY